MKFKPNDTVYMPYSCSLLNDIFAALHKSERTKRLQHDHNACCTVNFQIKAIFKQIELNNLKQLNKNSYY